MPTDYNPTDIDALDSRNNERDAERKTSRETEEADIQWLMSSKRGRRIVWRLLAQSEVFHSVFHPTAMVMAFKEGKRNYGLQMLDAVNKNCSELYTTMVKENTNGKPAV